jgi:cell division protein FtsX
MIQNEQQFNYLKSIAEEYRDILLNYQDLDSVDSFKKQQARVELVIKLLNFIKVNIFYILVALGFIILVILLFLINIDFNSFKKQIEVSKLL